MLQRKTSELKLVSRVRFLGYRQDFRKLLNAADIFLMPSYREGLPTVVMEAMSAGLPVIGTDIRGNRDLISHGKTGYLVKVNDAETMAEYLRELMEKKEQRITMGEKAREAVQPYGKNQVAREMEKIYRSLEKHS